MALTKESLRADIKLIVGEFPMFTGDNELGDTTIDLAIDQGLRRLERDRPKMSVVDITGDGGRYYPLTTAGGFTEWENRYSQITDIDYDVSTRISGDEGENLLSQDDGDYEIYQSANGIFNLKLAQSPTSSIVFRVYHTGRYNIDANLANQDIPVAYETALTYISIYHFLHTVEMHMVKGTDGSAGVQYSNFSGPTNMVEKVMRFYEGLYQKELGLEPNKIEAAAVTREFDIQFQQTGESYMFHSRNR